MAWDGWNRMDVDGLPLPSTTAEYYGFSRNGGGLPQVPEMSNYRLYRGHLILDDQVDDDRLDAIVMKDGIELNRFKADDISAEEMAESWIDDQLELVA